METNNIDLLLSVMEAVDPDHVDLLGEEQTRRIIAQALSGSSSDMVTPRGGHSLDYGQVAELVISLAGLTVSVLQLILDIRRKDPSATEKQVVEAVASRWGDDAERARRVATETVRRLDG